MLHGVKISSAVQELTSEGITYLYRGILPPLAQKTISLSVMFGVYDGVRKPLLDAGCNPYLTKIAGGLVAGMQLTISMIILLVYIILSRLISFRFG